MYELMRKESNRLKTFQMNPPWPKDYVDIKKLAKAGFFYAFNGDNVHCAFCRGQVCRWDREDDPMTEHAKHFTTCPFIMGGEVGNEPIGEDPFPGPKRPRPYDVCGSYPSFPPNDPRYDHQEQQLQGRQLDEVNSLQSDSDISIQSHDQDQNNNDPDHHRQQQPSLQSLLLQTSQQANQLLSSSQDSYNRYLQQFNLTQNYPIQDSTLEVNSIVTSSQSNLDVAAPVAAAQATSNNLNGICKICYTNPIELVFLPCGHLVSCLSCAQRLSKCPCCRETITTRIRTYLV